MQRPSQTVAGLCGLAGFAIAVLCGLWAGNPSLWVLGWALASLVLCHTVGRLAGELLQWLADQQMRRYEAEHPVPELPWVSAKAPSPPGPAAGAQ